MLIQKDSILNTLPKGLTEKETIFIETIIHSIRILDISYNRLIEQLLKEGDDLATELPMIDVWNIIDTSHRLRCILDKTPGIKKKEPWFQLTIRKLGETEDIRNFIQHYNREIENLISEVRPLLGHLSWITIFGDNQFKIGTIVPGNLRKFKGLGVVNPAGKLIRDRVDLITFMIGNYKISISDIYYQIVDLIKGLEKHLENITSA